MNAPNASVGGNSIPDLPDIPTGGLSNNTSVGGQSAGGGDDVDFDDLTRRFEELKKKKWFSSHETRVKKYLDTILLIAK